MPVSFDQQAFVWIEKLDDSVCAARKAVVPAVVETDGQNGTFVNGHFHNASVGNVHMKSSILLLPFNISIVLFNQHQQRPSAAASVYPDLLMFTAAVTTDCPVTVYL